MSLTSSQTRILEIAFLVVALGCQGQLAEDGSPDPAAPSYSSTRAIERSVIAIDGVSYASVQISGTPFRVVCELPCPLDDQLLSAKARGFGAVREQLVQLTGIDVLPELAPVDLHLTADRRCGEYRPDRGEGHAGVHETAELCLFDREKTNRALPLSAENALLPEDQLLALHEYVHAIFFRRHQVSYEDMAAALSLFIARDLEDPCAADLAVPAHGRLIHDLCRDHGLTYPMLKESLVALDSLYRAGAGRPKGAREPTSVHQYRMLLEEILGGDTAQAFLDAGLARNQVGDTKPLSRSGGRVSLLDGALVLQVPPGALAADIEVTVEQPTSVPTRSDLVWPLVYDLKPSDLRLSRPVTVTLRYDPARLLAGTREKHLGLFQVVSGRWVEQPGSTPDPARHQLTATLRSFGTIAILDTTRSR